MSEVLEPLAPTFGDTPSIPIGCNRLQSVATDREVWCDNGISLPDGARRQRELVAGGGCEGAGVICPSGISHDHLRRDST